MNFLRKVYILAVPAALSLILGGCSSSKSTVPSDFTLTVTPVSVTLAPGASQTLAVSATASGSFESSVSVSMTGLPSGVTASPATLTLAPGVAQNVTLSSAATAATTTASITVTGTSGTLVHTAAVSLTVSAAQATPNFSLAVSPASASLTVGGSTTVAVSATAVNAFTGSIAVAVSGLPGGVSAAPSSLTLTAGTPQNVVLTAAAGATLGSGTVTFTGTSGSLTNNATLALTTAAATSPAFSLSLAPSTQTLTIGNATGAQVAVTATAIDGFSGSVAIALSGLPTGVKATPATLTLTPGSAQNVTLVAASTAAAGSSTVTFTGTSGALSSNTLLTLTVQTQGVADVTTYHYDNTRQGLNAGETILTPANVNSTTFGKVGLYATDGMVDAQPLFAANVAVNATTTENLVFVATENDSVYAFSAASGAQVWKTSVLGTGEQPSDDHGCGQITPNIGITSTPVIDRSYGTHGAIFVVGMTKDSASNYHQRLHALDLTSGAELSGSPSEIAATYPGTGDGATNGIVKFDPAQYAERAGLLLLNGTIYLSWTSHCDDRPYTGWIMGYSESTLKQTTVLNLTPNGYEGSIWMAGYGLAADSSGNIYFLDANGSFSGNFNANGFPSDDNFGNAMIKLSTTGGKLAVADYFQPYNTVAESASDQDLGSGGAMLLPSLKDASGTAHQLLVGAGKDDNIYIADVNNMGKFNQNGTNNNIYQELDDALVQGAWSGPAYFNNTVYYGGQGDVLKAFPISNAKLAATPSSKSTEVFMYPGTTPAVSANGTSNGIVWAEEDNPGSPAVLHAYDATNLARELYNSNQAAAGRDSFGNGNKFMTPMIVNGNVYLGTPTGVAVFGLLNTP